MAGASFIATRSTDRTDYILHPTTGEALDDAAVAAVEGLRAQQRGQYDVQIVVSDGLNALAIMDQAQLTPFLRGCATAWPATDTTSRRSTWSSPVAASGRLSDRRAVVCRAARAARHPARHRRAAGTGHNTFSVYMTCPTGADWARRGKIDHDVTRVVAGIANTALAPTLAADAAVRVLREMRGEAVGVVTGRASEAGAAC